MRKKTIYKLLAKIKIFLPISINLQLIRIKFETLKVMATPFHTRFLLGSKLRS